MKLQCNPDDFPPLMLVGIFSRGRQGACVKILWREKEIYLRYKTKYELAYMLEYQSIIIFIDLALTLDFLKPETKDLYKYTRVFAETYLYVMFYKTCAVAYGVPFRHS